MQSLNCLFSLCHNRVIKESDTEIDITRKKILVVTSAISLPMSTSTLFYSYEKRILLFVASIFFLFGQITVLLNLLWLRRQATNLLIGAHCTWICIGIALLEIEGSAMKTFRYWPSFLIMIDTLLACQTPNKMTFGVIAFVISLILFIQGEDVFRFGLYDFEWGEYSQEFRRTRCECDNLPCRESILQGVIRFSALVIIFIVAFLCTRGFASSAIAEKKRILASIEAANYIAVSLSRFDLESASQLLEEVEIPTQLKGAFDKILCNLRTYKPYLPQSCFPFEDGSVISDSRSSHSSSSGSASLTASSVSARSVVNISRSFESMHASLLIANVRNSLSVLNCSVQSFSSLISDVISSTSDVIIRNRGTLDLFLGDRVFANFGASGSQRGHPGACVKAAAAINGTAWTLLERYQQFTKGAALSINIGMGSGELVCGDLGSVNIMRFSVVGDLSLLVCAVERASCQLGVAMLSEEGLYQQVKHTAEARVHLQTIFHNNKVHILYELLLNNKEQPVEWMYELENVGKWDEFNRIAVAILSKSLASEIPTGDKFDVLRELIHSGLPEPLVLSIK